MYNTWHGLYKRLHLHWGIVGNLSKTMVCILLNSLCVWNISSLFEHFLLKIYPIIQELSRFSWPLSSDYYDFLDQVNPTAFSFFDFFGICVQMFVYFCKYFISFFLFFSFFSENDLVELWSPSYQYLKFLLKSDWFVPSRQELRYDCPSTLFADMFVVLNICRHFSRELSKTMRWLVIICNQAVWRSDWSRVRMTFATQKSNWRLRNTSKST